MVVRDHGKRSAYILEVVPIGFADVLEEREAEAKEGQCFSLNRG